MYGGPLSHIFWGPQSLAPAPEKFLREPMAVGIKTKPNENFGYHARLNMRTEFKYWKQHGMPRDGPIF